MSYYPHHQFYPSHYYQPHHHPYPYHPPSEYYYHPHQPFYQYPPQPPPTQSTSFHLPSRKISADSGFDSEYGGSSRKTTAASVPEEREEPFQIPDGELCQKIVQQVEFYFSDENLAKDKFLLKHVKRNKEGLVSLKLISSFKRVKILTRDWRQVAFAVRNKSDKLQVNEPGTKVRRTDPIPDFDEDAAPSKTILALNLEKFSMESVAELFGQFGDIEQVRIIRPGNQIPALVKPLVSKNPEITSQPFALIDFDAAESVTKAIKAVPENAKVIELPSSSPGNKDPPKEQKQQQQPQQPRRKISVYENVNFVPDHLQPPYLALNNSYYQTATPVTNLPVMMRKLSLEVPSSDRSGFNNWCKNRMEKPRPRAVPIVAPPSNKEEQAAPKESEEQEKSR